MRLGSFFTRGRRPSEEEIARELRDHLDLDAEEMERSGAEPRAARLEARRRFGSMGSIQERTREAWGSIPRTSSGKPRRRLVWQQLLDRRLSGDVVYSAAG